MSRLDRWIPLSGLLAVVLLLAAAIMFGVYDYLPSGDRLVQVVGANPNGAQAAGYIGNVGALLFLVFASCSTIRVRQAEPTGGWLVKLAYGGGIGAGISLGIVFSLVIAMGSRAGATTGFSPAEASTLYDAYGTLFGQLFGLAMAAFMISASLAYLRAYILPAWFNWASILVGILLLTPGAYLLEIPALLWIIVMSIWMFRGQPPSV